MPPQSPPSLFPLRPLLSRRTPLQIKARLRSRTEAMPFAYQGPRVPVSSSSDPTGPGWPAFRPSEHHPTKASLTSSNAPLAPIVVPPSLLAAVLRSFSEGRPERTGGRQLAGGSKLLSPPESTSQLPPTILIPNLIMSELKAGDAFPEGVAFAYIAPAPETSEFSQCGIPIKYDASKEFKDKKVVLVSVPGAFTPTCSAAHVPSYTANFDKIKAKGVDQIIIVAVNDPFVQSGWAKANGIKDDSILFMSDADAKFSKSIGWNFGERTGRFAIVVDHGKVTYASKDADPGSIATSGAEGVLAQL
ncbi:hypothetical protein G7046_g3397 [Stylonectria norvegica]|nr:hypothetical protein G7046_g3397 [Stylonectria norvegica]